MINPQKVRVMSRSARFEHVRGREALKIKKYCEDMPVWKSMARSALAGVLLYLLILALVVLAAPDWFSRMRETFDDIWTAVIIAGSMAVCTAGYSIVSDLVFRSRYRKIRSTLCGYKSDINYLEKVRREQETNETAG